MRCGGRRLAAAVAAASAAPDRAELARLAAEHGVVTRPPGPSLRAYFAHLGARAAEAVVEWLRGLHWDLSGALPVLEVMAKALAAAVLAGTAWLLLRALARWNRARLAPGPDTPPSLPVARPKPRPAAWWRARVEAALAAGDTVAALAALWTWAAVRALESEPDPSWTSRDLVRASGRRELEPLLARLDRWRFGPRRPGPEDVRRLAATFEGALP